MSNILIYKLNKEPVPGLAEYVKHVIQKNHKEQAVVVVSSEQSFLEKYDGCTWQTRASMPIFVASNIVLKILFCLLLPVLFVRSFFSLLYWRVAKKADTLYLLSWPDKILLTLIAKIFGYKIYWLEYYLDVFNIPFWRWYKFNLLFVYVVGNSFTLYKKLIQAGVDKDRVSVVYPTISSRVYHQQNMYHEIALKKFSYPYCSNFVLGTVMVLKKNSGLEHVFNAIRLLKDPVPNIQLVIVGDGPEKKVLVWLTRQMGIEKYVRFVGFKEDRLVWLRSFHLFVLPTLEEWGFSQVLLEAMYIGVPVIVHRVGVFEELVENTKTGFVMDITNPEMLARAIINVANDQKWLQELGKNARERALQLFQG